MRTLCLLRPINGSFPTADYPAGQRSNLSTIYLEKNKKIGIIEIYKRNEEADIW